MNGRPLWGSGMDLASVGQWVVAEAARVDQAGRSHPPDKRSATSEAVERIIYAERRRIPPSALCASLRCPKPQSKHDTRAAIRSSIFRLLPSIVRQPSFFSCWNIDARGASLRQPVTTYRT